MKLQKLRIGDTVGIVCPAGTIASNSDRFKFLEERLESLGLKVKYGKTVGQGLAYLSGSDELRSADIMDMFLDDEVKVIIAMLGGYGSSRIVDKLDYDLIKNNPKLLIGFSDITVLLNAINKKTNIPTVHGLLGVYLGRPDLDDFSLNDFSKLLFENQINRILKNPKDDCKTLVEGVARGKLVGGNLSLINNLIGTPYEIDFDGKIVFIEEVKEEPYAIDRYLSALRLTGNIDKAAGFVLGYFTNCEPKNKDSWDYVELFRQYFSNLNKPVIYNFASGHELPFINLPIGLEVELDATLKQITILEEMYETD